MTNLCYIEFLCKIKISPPSQTPINNTNNGNKKIKHSMLQILLDLLSFITTFLEGTPCEIYFTYFSFKFVKLAQGLHCISAASVFHIVGAKVRKLLYLKVIWLDFWISRSKGFLLRGSFGDQIIHVLWIQPIFYCLAGLGETILQDRDEHLRDIYLFTFRLCA